MKGMDPKKLQFFLEGLVEEFLKEGSCSKININIQADSNIGFIKVDANEIPEKPVEVELVSLEEEKRYKELTRNKFLRCKYGQIRNV